MSERKPTPEEVMKRLAKLPHKTQKQLKEELRQAGKLKRGKPRGDQQS